jgi:OmpA-OmpF porin, OOP family
MTPKPLSIALAAALLGLSSQAQALDERWYLAPTLGYIHPDDRMDTGEDVGLGLAIGKPLDERWNVEFGVRGHNLDRDVGNNMKQRSMGIDGLYFFDRDPGFAPFALIGAGYLRSSLPGVADNGFSANIGLGFLKQVSENLALRADARYRWSETDMLGRGLQNDDWLVNLGVHIPLGAKPIKTAAAPSQSFAEPSAPLLPATSAPAAPVETASPAPAAVAPAEPASPAPPPCRRTGARTRKPGPRRRRTGRTRKPGPRRRRTGRTRKPGARCHRAG